MANWKGSDGKWLKYYTGTRGGGGGGGGGGGLGKPLKRQESEYRVSSYIRMGHIPSTRLERSATIIC